MNLTSQHVFSNFLPLCLVVGLLGLITSLQGCSEQQTPPLGTTAERKVSVTNICEEVLQRLSREKEALKIKTVDLDWLKQFDQVLFVGDNLKNLLLVSEITDNGELDGTADDLTPCRDQLIATRTDLLGDPVLYEKLQQLTLENADTSAEHAKNKLMALMQQHGASLPLPERKQLILPLNTLEDVFWHKAPVTLDADEAAYVAETQAEIASRLGYPSIDIFRLRDTMVQFPANLVQWLHWIEKNQPTLDEKLKNKMSNSEVSFDWRVEKLLDGFSKETAKLFEIEFVKTASPKEDQTEYNLLKNGKTVGKLIVTFSTTESQSNYLKTAFYHQNFFQDTADDQDTPLHAIMHLPASWQSSIGANSVVALFEALGTVIQALTVDDQQWHLHSNAYRERDSIFAFQLLMPELLLEQRTFSNILRAAGYIRDADTALPAIKSANDSRKLTNLLEGVEAVKVAELSEFQTASDPVSANITGKSLVCQSACHERLWSTIIAIYLYESIQPRLDQSPTAKQEVVQQLREQMLAPGSRVSAVDQMTNLTGHDLNKSTLDRWLTNLEKNN